MPRIRICICHPSEQHCEQIVEAFRQQDPELELVALTDVARALGPIKEQKADLVVVGVDAPGDPLLRTISSIQTDKEIDPGIIVVSQHPSQELLVACMRAGSDEFLQFPIDGDELRDALQRLCRKKGIIEQAAGKITAVYSAKGGTGSTSIASNLALNLARLLGSGTGVCLLDVNTYLGNVALMLDIRKFSHSLADACRDVERLDAALISSYMTRHESGAAVLPAPLNIEEADEIEAAGVAGVIRQCQEVFAHVILDLPHTLDPLSMAGLDAADQVLLVCDMLVPTIQNTKRTAEVFRDLGLPNSKLKLVINRYYDSSDVSLQQISEHVQLPVYWVIPYDSPVAIASANSGRTFDEVDARCDLSRSMAMLAQELAGVQSKEKGKKKFALFGHK